MSILLIAAVVMTAEVDVAEVHRLGDTVQHMDGFHGEGVNDAYVAAMAPPQSDAHKWFVSIVTKQGCPACAKLKADWRTSARLQAFAIPGDQKNSWAHYNEYDVDDKSQTFRFADIQIEAYPTIMLQPPRNGHYGDPSTLVYEQVYGGDPDATADDMADALKRYIAALTRRFNEQHKPGVGADDVAVGGPPPWRPPPKPDLNPQPTPGPQWPQWPRIPPDLVPPVDAERLISIPWGKLFALFGFTTVGGILVVAVPIGVMLLRSIRSERKRQGDDLLIRDDDLFERLIDLLETFGQVSESSTPKQSARKTLAKAKVKRARASRA